MCGSYYRNRPPPTKGEKATERCLAVLGCGALVCALPLLPFYLAFKGAHNSSAYTDYKRKRAAKPPKPVRRKRALSICPSSEGSNPRKPKLSAEQTQSGFFNLPIELRTAIYEELVGRDEIYILLLDNLLCSYPCCGLQTHECADRSHKRHLWTRSCQPQLHPRSSFYQPGIGIMGALQSCRRVYTEMVPLLYSTPRFLFSDPLSLLGFSATILPQRFNSIRSVHIDQRCGPRSWPRISYNSVLNYSSIRHLRILGSPFPRSCEKPENMILFRVVCEVLCKMKALKELRLDLTYHTLQYKQATVKEQREGTLQEVDTILKMLSGRDFKTLDISFDTLAPLAAGWIDLSFVRLRPDSSTC